MANGATEIDQSMTCASLLRELQKIWDEVGESNGGREEILQQIEQECLQVYKRKVDQAASIRTRLQKSLSEAEAELASLISRLGDRPLLGRSEKQAGNLKDQLASIQPQLDELRRKQDMRAQQFIDVKSHIERITHEILDSPQLKENGTISASQEEDLSLKRLDEFHAQLQSLQKEKSERLHKVLGYVNSIHELCAVLGMDFFKTIKEVHPSLDESSSNQSKSISNSTLNRLDVSVRSLGEEKTKRIMKLRELGTSLIELWTLMDTSAEEQQLFGYVTCILNMSEDEVSSPQALGLGNIEQAEVEVERLDKLKAKRTKELVMKKKEDLDEICRHAHMDPDQSTSQENLMAIIDSGKFDPSELLARMDHHISKAKDEALSRKDILEKVEKWMAACEEENWLEDYNRDQNRFNATRGAHLNLKRAERARITVNKLQALMDSLVTKTKAWEEEGGFPFVYDGKPLLDMLDEYKLLRHKKEEEKRHAREQKKLQEQLLTEQETVFGSRSSPNKQVNAKKSPASRTNGSTDVPNRRLSLNTGVTLPSGITESLVINPPTNVNGVLTPVRLGKDGKKEKCRSKEDTSSVYGSEPTSPLK